jgi:integrase
LIQRYREELQARHYARRTVDTYEQWLRRFLRFHRMRHPCQMGEAEINAFLSHLATEEGVSASTQNQALAALLLPYRTVLGGDVGNLEGVIRARKRQRLPVVLTIAPRNGEEVPECSLGMGLAMAVSPGRRWRDPRQSIEGRHHLDPSLVQRAARAAVQAAGLSEPATCHTFRLS